MFPIQFFCFVCLFVLFLFSLFFFVLFCFCFVLFCFVLFCFRFCFCFVSFLFSFLFLLCFVLFFGKLILSYSIRTHLNVKYKKGVVQYKYEYTSHSNVNHYIAGWWNCEKDMPLRLFVRFFCFVFPMKRTAPRN